MSWSVATIGYLIFCAVVLLFVMGAHKQEEITRDRRRQEGQGDD
ncbi:hypothetical protein [Oricola indica]